MANLRIVSIVVDNSANITATFNANLNEDIGVANMSIVSQTAGAPDSFALIVNVVGNILNINVNPLTPQASYLLTFLSTPTVPFKSLNGDAFLPQDGVSNQYFLTAPIAPGNPIQTYFNNFLQDNVYNTGPTTTITQYVNALSTTLSQALYDIRQTRNENYLSFTVVDEFQTRGAGPFDRLAEESAYEVLRVAKTPTHAFVSSTTNVPSFPAYEVSLIAAPNTENLTPNSVDIIGAFNINTLQLDLSKIDVIILTSVVFVYNSALQPYTYDISRFGYRILNSNYDPDFAFTYLQLESNQILLNQAILNDPLFSTENIAFVQVSYQYKNTGKIIDPITLFLDTVIASGREITPPIENVFTLAHAPVVSSNDQPGELGDVTFINPNAVPGSNTPHPAFLYEVPYSLSYLPSNPGEYAIDYPTGTVYVYGADFTQDGTGAYPPIAVYSYRYMFKSQVDYVYDQDNSDLVALPNGNLTQSSANITYKFEEVLAQNIDYTADVHIESLNENIGNRLVALNAVQPLNFPITNVFRIYNQTTGELYKVLRWNDNTIYFTYNIAPNIEDAIEERASFQSILNEILTVNATTPVSISQTLFQIDLANNNIMANSEDCIGSSFNTSVYFANTNIFKQEIYFDETLSISENNGRLTTVGDYQIDYANGIVYIIVSPTQGLSVGTVSYKRGYINPINPQVLTVNNIYYKLTLNGKIVKTFPYVNFSVGSILPGSFDISNEAFLNDNEIYPYELLDQVVGTFVNTDFTPGVSDDIKYIRGLYEQDDLLFNTIPLNFAGSSAFNGKIITVSPLSFTEYSTVQFDGTHYYVLANTSLLYKSPNITFNASVIRLLDQEQLWDSSGTIGLGQPFKLILSGANSPTVGNAVLVTYSFTINDLSHITVDYNKGDYYVDYSYLADEILISYEYGDNVLDFRSSVSLAAGDNYYVTYKVGALREALLQNFGTLINISILNSLDVGFNRERYRDAIMAAMQSFPEGPTLPSMENLVEKIVHTPPTIIETAFQNWILGTSLLTQEPITTAGTISLIPAKYGNGAVIDTPGQLINFPVTSNLRLEEGTFSCWVIPEWNGLDNKANLTFTITKNGQPFPASEIFIGSSGFQPIYDGYSFALNTNDPVLGQPNEHKNGIFIYYAPDQSNAFNRWYMDVIDGYSDGYGIKNYTFNIQSNGKFYDVKSTLTNKPSSDSITSGNSYVKYSIIGSSNINQGLTFLSDTQHYIFDWGNETNNRFSIFKDESGYMNFRVIGQDKTVYTVDADVSSWRAGQKHYVSAAWQLNKKGGGDEIHLFLDGLEVANIIKYGSKVAPYLHEKFRTINPEEFVGSIPKSIVGADDLVTTSGSPTVTSSVNFSAAGISSGDTIFIDEPGFSTMGYAISTVNGQTLTLTAPLGITSTNSTFSVNPTTLTLLTEVDLYPGFIVLLLSAEFFGSDITTTVGLNQVSATSTNFQTLGVQPGYVITINESGFNSYYTILSVSTNTLVLDSIIPSSHTNAAWRIYPNTPIEIPGENALHPSYFVTRNATNQIELTLTNDVQANDIVLVETLGLNNQFVNQNYYVWGNTSNIIKTQLPAPILLADVDITHILLGNTLVGPSNSTLSGWVFTSNNIFTDQPSVSDNGRTLAIYVSGENIDYTHNVTVTIFGNIEGVSSSEIVTFTKNTTKNTVNKFETINHVVVVCKPLNPAKNCLVFSVSEAFPITQGENSVIVPVIQFSYQMMVGNTLQGSGSTVTDPNGFFSSESVGNYLVISSPAPVAGQYKILSISLDNKSATISGSLSSFTNGIYQVLNVSVYRSGLQNGFFTLEDGYSPGTPYPLKQGLYNFQYATYLSIKIDTDRYKAYIGTDINGNNLFDGTIDELLIVSQQLTDTRIGETSGLNQETITKDFNSLVPLVANQNTLMLIHFDKFPFENSSDIYILATDKYIQSSNTINDNFGQSIVLTEVPYVIDNGGILDTHSQAMIEFWINPLIDTGNDPNYRFYFDATSAVSEQSTSINNATVKTSGKIEKILNVKLKTGNQSVDYFAGGKIDVDGRTLFLNRQLPNENTQVIINYIPAGTNGDRISIYKDPYGYVNFDVRASGIDYQIRSPIFWVRNSWHRIKATYVVNHGIGTDELHFFVDGYEQGNILYGTNLLYGQGAVFGSSYAGESGIMASIKFNDIVNQLFIGSDYTNLHVAKALINNLKISNRVAPIFAPFGDAIDVNYSPNLSIVQPVQPDLYTTLLQNFDTLLTKNTLFSIIKNRDVGNYDFTVEVFDLFHILRDNPKSRQILEILINTLKPANSQAFILYE